MTQISQYRFVVNAFVTQICQYKIVRLPAGSQAQLSSLLNKSFGGCCGFYLEIQLLRSGLLCPLTRCILDLIASLLVTLNGDQVQAAADNTQKVCRCKLLSQAAGEPES